MIIYLHGFRSSPASFKSQMMAAQLAVDATLESNRGRDLRFFSPQLPASPREAVSLVLEKFKPGPDDTLIGSSLGGYYATWLAEQCGSRCVLLNPAVHAARDLAGFVGEMKMFHSDEPFVFKAEYIDELWALEVARITRPDRYVLVAAKGDELLDWREMVAKYPAVRAHLLEGSDHGMSDFAKHMTEVLAFA